MKNKIQNLACLIVIVLSVQCNKQETYHNSISVDSLTDSLIRIQHWYLLGPFPVNQNLPIYERQEEDFLAAFGTKEIDLKGLDQFIQLGKVVSKSDSSVKFLRYIMPKYTTDIMDMLPVEGAASAYFAAEVTCDTPLNVCLAFSAYQSCKVWLNGTPTYDVEWKRGQSNYREELVPICLRKGSNLLVAKVTLSDLDYSPLRWRFELDICSKAYANRLFHQAYSHCFLRRGLIENGRPLKVYTGPYSGQDVQIEIRSEHGESTGFDTIVKADVYSGVANVPLSRLSKEGIYRCEWRLGQDTFSQLFFFGDISKEFYLLKASVEKLKRNVPEQNDNINSLLREIELRLDTRRGHLHDHLSEIWDRSRIPAMDRLTKLVDELSQSHPYPNSNFFIRSYQSSVYAGEHTYSAHIPINLKQEKVPLFILLYYDKDPSPKWYSHWVNQFPQFLDEIRKLADQLSFITVWTNCGGGDDSTSLTTVFKEIVRDATGKLPVDTNRVFIVGNCASTNMALDLLKNSGNILAGAGFINPLPTSSEYFNSQSAHHLCMVYAHDDEKNPSDQSLSFYKQLQGANPDAELFVSYKATHYTAPPDFTLPIFDYLLKNSEKH